MASGMLHLVSVNKKSPKSNGWNLKMGAPWKRRFQTWGRIIFRFQPLVFVDVFSRRDFWWNLLRLQGGSDYNKSVGSLKGPNPGSLKAIFLGGVRNPLKCTVGSPTKNQKIKPEIWEARG